MLDGYCRDCKVWFDVGLPERGDGGYMFKHEVCKGTNVYLDQEDYFSPYGDDYDSNNQFDEED